MAVNRNTGVMSHDHRLLVTSLKSMLNFLLALDQELVGVQRYAQLLLKLLDVLSN